MKATELRIGNIVIASFSTGDNTLHTVTAGDFGKSAAGTLVCESFMPERLTSQWFHKLGFVELTFSNEDQEESYVWSKGTVSFHTSESDSKPAFFFGEDGEVETQIEFVHELQNLYFALTAIELTPQ